MGPAYWQNPVFFLLNTAFTLYMVVVMLRFLLRFGRADFFNPVNRFLFEATEPVLRPLRTVIRPYRGIDFAALLLLLVLQIAYYSAVLTILKQPIPFVELPRWALADLTILLLNVYLFSILIEVVLSWINPGRYSPAQAVIYQLNAPVLNRIRSAMPAMGGLDFSPLIALVVIQVLKMFLQPFTPWL
ncbi:MAG: YggT family protein [Pseudomonadota bacterium]|nr:YggT family protein [Pseudomonadota bacterium]